MNRFQQSKLIPMVLLPTAVILMEVFSMYPWIIWLGKQLLPLRQKPPLSFVSCLLLISITYVLTRYFLRLKWPIAKIQISLIACLLFIIFITLKIEYGYGFGFFDAQWFFYIGKQLFSDITLFYPMIMALFTCIYIIWRGIRRGRSVFFFSTIYRSFLIGLAASIFLLIVVGIRSPFATFEQMLSNLGINIACFFFFGLMAMALINIQGIQERIAEKEGSKAFNHRWLYIITGIIALIILAGIFFTSVFSAEIVGFLDTAASTLWNLIVNGLYYVVFLPIGFIVAGLVYIVRFLVSLLQREQLSQQPQSDFSEFQDREQLIQSIPPEIILILKWLLIILIVAFIFFLLVKAISRQLAPTVKDDIEETSESVWSRQEFSADVRRFVAGIFNRFKTVRDKRVLEDAAAERYRSDDGTVTLNIREIYRHLLWNASDRGLKWRQAETPYEYAKRFAEALPEAGKQINDLTDIYIGVRYGDSGAEEKQIDYANSLWRSLKGILVNRLTH